MSKSPYTPEWKITIIKKYLSGEGSYERIADAYGIGSKTLKDWVHRYKEQGAAGFYRTAGNSHYLKYCKIEDKLIATKPVVWYNIGRF